jgi:D-3-phosphoglycerate dehydrogenase
MRRGLEGIDYELLHVAGEGWASRAAHADALIVNLLPVRRAELQALRRCKVVARLGTGVDNVDLASADELGIAVTHVKDYCSEEVSDHVLALALSWLRFVCQANSDMAEGRWLQTSYRPIRRVSTQTLGLLGYGKLARAVARKASGLGMNVIAFDPAVDRDPEGHATLRSFDDVVTEADILSLHMPLTERTRGIMNEDTFSKVRRNALLINTARGGLVDEDALVAALDAGRLGGAAIDVFETEPWTKQSTLRGHPRVLLTPHMAFYSEDSLESLEEQAARSVREVLTNGTSSALVPSGIAAN